MKKTLLFLLLTVFMFTTAQVRFDKAYMIDNQGVRSEILIKNLDWSFNPTEFSYKTSENGNEMTANIKNVKEFGVNNFSRYIRFTGNIDQSSDNLQILDHEKNPKWEQQTVFLKQLAEGKRNLYTYNDSKILRFFYSDSNTEITQLIYKRYYLEDENSVYTNNEFRSQLANSFAGDLEGNKFDNLPYKTQSLTNLFKKYNNSDEVLKSDADKSSFNLYIKPGISFNSASFEIAENNSANVDFESKTGVKFGIELEYVLPTRRNKWSVFFEPNYQSAKHTGVNFTNNEATLEYNVIELPVGARYYMFLNQNSKIFLEGFVSVAELAIGENYIRYGVPGTTAEKEFELNTGVNFGGGIGFAYKSKYLLSARYSAKNLGMDYTFFKVPYSSFSVMAAYNIF